MNLYMCVDIYICYFNYSYFYGQLSGGVWWSMVECGAVWWSVVEYGGVWCSVVECGRVLRSMMEC